MRPFLTLLLLAAVALPGFAAGKANTIVFKPGEIIYARFEPDGKKIRLVSASKVKDEHAQVIFTTAVDKATLEVNLTVENKFHEDFYYEVVIRSKKLDRETPLEVSSVVGEKMAFESIPPLTDEIVLSAFKLLR